MKLVALAITLLAAGVWLIWAAHERIWNLALDLSIKPLDVATLVVTTFVAFFLQHYLVGRASNSRAEKDLLIDNVREVVRQLRTCRDAMTDCQDSEEINPENRRAIIANFRLLSNEVDNLRTVLEESGCCKLVERCEELSSDYVALKMAATGGNFPTKPYSVLQCADQLRAFRSMNRHIQSLAFAINKHD